MALQFVFGNSGFGKTQYLYNYITEQSEKHPEKNYMVLVPEQFTMQTQKDLVLMHKRKGIMNIDVLSFARLAHRIFEEVGHRQIPILDDEGKNLILRKLAGNCEDSLKVLNGNIKKLGYISEVKSVISEFTQYDIHMEEIERIKKLVGKETYLYHKLQDIELLYDAFTTFLKEKYITKEELLDVLIQKIPESNLLKRSTVVLDGFTGFTPVQVRLLSSLLQYCEDVIITVTIDKREDPYTYAHPYQLFGLSKQMVSSLIAAAKEVRGTVKEPICLYDGCKSRFLGSQALLFLENQLFRYGSLEYKNEQEEIELHVARNPKEEAMAAAGAVRALLRKEKYRYREIGVIVSDLSIYGTYLEQAFEIFQIPIFMDQKKSVLLNSFVEYLRSLIGMAEKNFTIESVFRFLRAGYSHMTYDELDMLENYVVSLGIKGFKRWQEKWIRRPFGVTEEELEMLNHMRVTFVEEIQELIFVMKQRSKTVRDITEALYDYLVEQQMEAHIKEQEKMLIERKELALAKEYAQVYKIVLELFDKFVALLGDEKVGVEEYAKLLDAGLSEAKVGVIPPGVDQVVVGDVERTRIKDVKALFFLGANDVHLPGKLGKNGLLNECDREIFAKEKLNLTPGGKEKTYIQKFYLYQNMTRPSEKLYIYYSKVSAEGKTIRPSYLIQEVQRLFPDLSVVDEESQSVQKREITEATGIEVLIDGLKMKDEKSGSAWAQLYTWYKKNPQWKEKMEELLEASFYKRPKDTINKRQARQLYGETFEDSITRMEQFSACAFAHFLKYGLKLRERQEYEFRPLDMGNVFHGAMEKYALKLQQVGKGWTQIPEKLQEAYADESMEQAITDYGNSVLYSSARNVYTIQRLKRMMRRTVWALTKQIEKGAFVPEAYEMRFSNGKIDRVDTCVEEDKVYVKVMDYKTGTKAFDITSLYHGLQLQLMVYMNAAVDVMAEKYPQKEIVPAGVFYYQIDDPFVKKQKCVEDIELEVLKELKPDGIVNAEAASLARLDTEQAGESVAAPVKWNRDGTLSQTSHAVDKESFQVMTKYAIQKLQKQHEKITEGEAEINPYAYGSKTGCDYCKYGHICGFDRKIAGYEYRNIKKKSIEEIISEMKGDIE